MKLRATIWMLILLAVALPLPAQTPAQNTPNTSVPTKADAKRADELLHRAIRLQSQDKLEAASDALDVSVGLNPNNATTATVREYIRQQRVEDHMDRGNRLLEKGNSKQAAVEFRAALDLDPSNSFAEQRYRDASGPAMQAPPVAFESTVASEVILTPRSGTQNFSFRGDSRQLLETIGRAYGITVTFDESVASRTVRFDLENVNFETAMQAAHKVTHTFYVPISPTQILVANDSQDTRRRLERMSLRIFYVPEQASPQDLQETINMLRTMLDVRFVSADALSSTITVRAPGNILNAAQRLIENLGAPRPEILLDVRAIQISESAAHNIGLNLPLQFTAFNVDTEARALLASSPNVQGLINSLISGGTISPADAAAVAALLASQQNSSSPLLQPFATFGGGKTLTGVGIPPLSANIEFNQSITRVIQDMTLRAQQGKPATFRVGDRFPVLTSSYAPLVNIPVPPGLQARNNAQPLTPSFNYEDLGITLKATPQVNGGSNVTLQFELAVKALAGMSFNGVPTISNREFKGTISVKAGETSVIAGSLDENEQKSLRGMPWISQIPGLKQITSSSQKQFTGSQLLFLITPHITEPARGPDASSETYLESN